MAQTIRRALFGAVGALVVTGVVAAQTPQSPSTSQNPPRSTTTIQDRIDTDRDQPIVVTGCLKEEGDVPGREPNVAERAGILEDFILTNAKVGAGSASASAGASSSGASSASGASSQSAAASSQRPSGSSQSAAGSADSDRAANAGEQSAAGSSTSQQGASTQSGRQSSSSASQSASAGPMYKVEGLDDEQLRRHANQQVEIRGTIDPDDARDAGVSSGSAAGRDASQVDAADDELPEIEAESIRMVAASCPAN